MNRAQLIIASGKEKAIGRRHPWIFSGAVKRIVGEPQEGDVVDVVDSHGQWLAVGHFQNESIICKVLSFDTPQVDEEFFRRRIQSAIDYRRRLGFFDYLKQSESLAESAESAEKLGWESLAEIAESAERWGMVNVFRLVHAEGDLLPGLVCDWYNGVLVMQAHSEGMHRMFPMLSRLFAELLQPYGLHAIFDKSSATLKTESVDGFIWGMENGGRKSHAESAESAERLGMENGERKTESGEWEIVEHGNFMLINFFEGQKTGFFIDQRENRALVQQLAKGHRVLNCFGYTGGFSLSALRGGAEYVETVDISKKAIDLCNRNVELNFGSNAPHQGTVADVLQFLAKNLDVSANSQFDFIILDPPAFAKNHRSLQQGLKGYRTINQRAMEALPKGGLLMTFSCSQAVSKEDFQTMVFTAASLAHREVRIVRQLPHAMDHPVSIYHPEGEYLKGLLLEIEN